MAEVEQSLGFESLGHKRVTLSAKKHKMAKKRRMKIQEGAAKKLKIDKKMKKLFQKRALEYNSDEDDEEFGEDERHHSIGIGKSRDDADSEDAFSGDDEKNIGIEEDDGGVSEDEDGGIQLGVMKFTESIKAFKLSFKKIVKKSGDDDVLGPVLSTHKKLIAEKLAEEEAGRKVKGESKKDKHLVRVKGHFKPANYLDAHEKLLLGVATKGVVKLFNAVSKARSAQKGLNPSRSKDEKAIKKLRVEAFFSEISKTGSQSVGAMVKVGSGDGEPPAWAPLRDNYILTNPKLKDWDKIQNTNAADVLATQSETDYSSDDE